MEVLLRPVRPVEKIHLWASAEHDEDLFEMAEIHRGVDNGDSSQSPARLSKLRNTSEPQTFRIDPTEPRRHNLIALHHVGTANDKLEFESISTDASKNASRAASLN